MLIQHPGRPPRARLAVALVLAALLAAVLSVACESPYAGTGTEASPIEEASEPQATEAEPLDAEGFVVWESSRSGWWRLWIRDLEAGRPARQLTPDEDSRQHCCPHIAPDGRKIAWLSLPHGQQRYPESGAAGRLHLMAPDGSGDRVIVDTARTYSEHRAAVWHSPTELLYIDGEGRSRLLDLERDTTEVLVGAPRDAHGWLVNPSRTHATTGWPSFSPYDAASRRVLEARERGGCQPYFTHDGRWGFWIAGTGGPLNALDLENGRVKTVLRKSDPRLPGDGGYLYFPMWSTDGAWLAWAASNDEHDHHQANYEVYVAPTDPATLELIGLPRRLSDHPATDRFPDVWAPPGAARKAPPRPAEPPSEPPPTAAEGWPSDRRGLVALWSTDDGRNQITEPLTGDPGNTLVTAHGRAFFDRHWAMVLAGGRFALDEASARSVHDACQHTNELGLELTLTPAPGAAGAVLAFADGDGFNLRLSGRGERLYAQLRTRGARYPSPEVDLGHFPPGRTVHLAMSYTPGRLRAWVDGEPAVTSEAIQSGFFHWRPRALTFGQDTGDAASAWRGHLEGLAIYNRTLDDAEARRNARLYAEMREARPAVELREVRGRLVERGEIPRLAEISPYREALAVFTYEVGGTSPSRVRVAHRVLLDGETLPIAGRALGERFTLRLEPFLTQPQLESLYVDPRIASPAFFDPAID